MFYKQRILISPILIDGAFFSEPIVNKPSCTVKVLLKVWQSSLFVVVTHAHVHIIIVVNEHNVKTLLKGIVEV